MDTPTCPVRTRLVCGRPPDRPQTYVHRRPHLPLCALVETVHAGCQRALGGHQPCCFPPQILEEWKKEAESRQRVNEMTEIPKL